VRPPIAVVGLVVAGAGACAGAERPGGNGRDDAPMSRAADVQMVAIPGGRFVAGSTVEERGAAYDAYLATAGHDTAREQHWFDNEADRHVDDLPPFRLDLMPVTNAAYAERVAAGGRPPAIDEATWRRQGLEQAFAEVERFLWRDGRPPAGREDHPVVLVTWDDATDYCAWRGRVVGDARRLPTARELEKASRGEQGFTYPWGNTFEPDKLNSAVRGPRDTVPVGSFPAGQSPYGVLDLAGNVFQWSSTPWPRGDGQRTVRGSAWDDFGGLGRGASWHGRPRQLRHVLIGFRCAADVPG